MVAPTDILQKTFSEVFHKIHRKAPVQEFLFNKDAEFSPQLYYEKITQESNLTICKHASFLWNTQDTSYYEACQARHFRSTSSTLFFEARQARDYIKHAKQAIFWSASITSFYEVRRARQFFEARQARHFMKHVKHVSKPITQASKAGEQVSPPST